MNHIQRLNEVKELKIFFFAQRANTRKQASRGRPLPCDDLAPTVQSRTGAHCPDLTRQRRAQKTSSYITVRPWPPGLIIGPCSSERACAVQLAHPPPPPFSPILGPRSLKLCVSFPCICSPPVCIIRSVTSLSSATTTCTPDHPFSRLTAIRTHHPMSHVSLREAPSRLQHMVFPPEGLCFFFFTTGSFLPIWHTSHRYQGLAKKLFWYSHFIPVVAFPSLIGERRLEIGKNKVEVIYNWQKVQYWVKESMPICLSTAHWQVLEYFLPFGL